MELSVLRFRIKPCGTLRVGTYQLPGQKGHVLDDGQSHAPLGILCQLDDSRQQRLGKLADSNDLIHTIQVGDDVKANLGTLKEMDVI